MPAYKGRVGERATPAASGGVAPVTVNPFLQTKLHRPPPPKDLVPRTSLLRRLEAERVRPLTLVCAPAGYGKSVLIGSWLEGCDWQSAWISLEKGDSSLQQFLIYFLAAVRNVFPQACEESMGLAKAPDLPPVATWAATLCNELDALERPLIVVLDDYQHINVVSPVHDLLQRLLAHPPIPLHLVVLSRTDPPLPLATLRAQGQMTEIRMHDLRFDTTETRSLIEKIAGFTASDEALTHLEQEVEGWAAGVRLVSLASRQLGDPERFLGSLHGGVQHVEEYFVHEVIDRQPHAVRDRLLKTAVLDRLCGSLCDAVCSREGETHSGTLEGDAFVTALRDQNLFVVPLDSQGEWFRYHHQFQGLLQRELSRRLAPGEIAEVHLRASVWFEARELIDEAIQHALKAGDPRAAAEIVERHYRQELDQDNWYVLERWLERLPGEIKRQRPKLLLAQAWIHYERWWLRRLADVVELAVSRAGHGAEQRVCGELCILQGVYAYWSEGYESSLRCFERARKLLSGEPTPAAGLLELWQALATYSNGNKELAVALLDGALRNVDASRDRFVARLVGGLFFVDYLSGDLVSAEREADRLGVVGQKSRARYTRAWGSYLQASVHLHAQNLEQARAGFAEAVRARHVLHTRAALDALAGLVLTQQLLQQADAARESLDLLLQAAREHDDSHAEAVAASCAARLALLQGDLTRAGRWARSVTNIPLEPSQLFIFTEIPSVTQARVLTALGGEEDLTRAMELLREIRSLSESYRYANQVIESAVLQCLALERLGRGDEALVQLREALAMAEPGGWIRPFVEPGRPMAELLGRLVDYSGPTEFTHSVLDALDPVRVRTETATRGLGPRRAARGAWTEEVLTRRELDILELMAARLQNKEMAARLYVSTETVKTHVKHLYQKLGVTNRRDGAAKAVEIIRTLRPTTRFFEKL